MDGEDMLQHVVMLGRVLRRDVREGVLVRGRVLGDNCTALVLRDGEARADVRGGAMVAVLDEVVGAFVQDGNGGDDTGALVGYVGYDSGDLAVGGCGDGESRKGGKDKDGGCGTHDGVGRLLGWMGNGFEKRVWSGVSGKECEAAVALS